jgi:hypothetical protein
MAECAAAPGGEGGYASLDPVEAILKEQVWENKSEEEIKEEIALKLCHDDMAKKVQQISVTFFAKVGNGKSSSANTLLQAWGYDGPGFDARRQREMVTTELQKIEQGFKDPTKPAVNAAEAMGRDEAADDGEQREDAAPIGAAGDGEQGGNPFEEDLSAKVAEGDPEAVVEAAECDPEAAVNVEADDREASINAAGRDAEAKTFTGSIVLRVIDQPGLFDLSGHNVEVSGEHQNGYHVLFLVQKITDRLDAGEQAILRIFRRFYGVEACRRIVLVLTYSDVSDTEEEISQMCLEAKADVEKELGAEILRAIAITNHPSRSDAKGNGRVKGGREMISAMYDVVCSESGAVPFKPAEEDYETIVGYVDEEVEKHPGIKKDALLGAVLRFVPVKGKKKLCAIL